MFPKLDSKQWDSSCPSLVPRLWLVWKVQSALIPSPSLPCGSTSFLLQKCGEGGNLTWGHLRELLGGVILSSSASLISTLTQDHSFWLSETQVNITQSYSFRAIKPVVQIDLKQVETRKSLYFLLTQRGLRFFELDRCDWDNPECFKYMLEKWKCRKKLFSQGRYFFSFPLVVHIFFTD